LYLDPKICHFERYTESPHVILNERSE
jgi:hypothetical protein